MRFISFFVPLLLVSGVAVGQNNGVLILKSDQPYVSPFDKTPPGRTAPAATLFPPTAGVETAPPGEAVNIEVREVEKRETKKRAEAFVAKKQPKPSARKENATRKTVEPRAIVKRESKPTAAAPALPIAVAAEMDKNEASVIPPKESQNAKSVLTLPPPALTVKDNGLTNFGKSTTSELTPTISVPTTSAPAVAITPEKTLSAPVAVRQNIEPVAVVATALPAWLLQAIIFFLGGGLLLLGTWYWVKRQALHGDPAFKDPWFRPVKSR